MAVTVINGGTFTKAPGDRPGLYVRFVDKAIATISVGARSKVATAKVIPVTGGGTAVKDKVYRIKNMQQAVDLFGPTNVEDIERIFQGGGSEVVVTTYDPAASTWSTILERLETYEFHVYVNPYSAAAALVTASIAFMKACRTKGKNFVGVFTDKATEGNVATTKTAATAAADEYSVFVGNGVKDAAGNIIDMEKYSWWIAGKIAGTPLDGSLTYLEVPYAEVITRYKSADVQELLAAGILLTVMDGDQPQIEQGLTLGTGKFNKIRTVRAKQAMIDDIDKAVRDNYVGKITNNENGQIAVINAIKGYLKTIADANVIAQDFVVDIDTTQPNTGAELSVVIGVKFLDSIEYVYLTISV